MSLVIDQLIRSRRKRVSLQVLPDARLIVRAPKWATHAEIQALLERKAEWILRQQVRARERAADVVKKTFTEGERFLFLGNSYPLVLVDSGRKPLTFDGDFFYLKRSWIDRGDAAFVRWYKEQALVVITGRVETLAEREGLSYGHIRISSAERRWGSCSRSGNLNFSWKLALAPQPAIDYVVAHEVAHLKHPNHSLRFWEYVERLMPDYKKEKMWLKKQGHMLSL